MIKPNKTKAKLKAGGVVFGVTVGPNEIAAVELAGVLGFDYVVCDWEHYLFDERAIEETIRAADLHGLTTIVRMENNAEHIQRVLNAGAQGILVARVNTPEDVRRLLDAAKYHPEGRRTVFYNSRGGNFGTDAAPIGAKQWGLDTNRETLVGCIVEEITGVDNLAKLLAFPEIDMIHLGRLDLAHSMGWPEQGKVDALVDKVIAESVKARKAVSTTWAGHADNWQPALAKGFRMFVVSPRGYFKSGGAKFLQEVKAIAKDKGISA
jgi:4-hydroxy-2-oxoheptanedioate aldolase